VRVHVRGHARVAVMRAPVAAPRAPHGCRPCLRCHRRCAANAIPVARAHDAGPAGGLCPRPRHRRHSHRGQRGAGPGGCVPPGVRTVSVPGRSWRYCPCLKHVVFEGGASAQRLPRAPTGRAVRAGKPGPRPPAGAASDAVTCVYLRAGGRMGVPPPPMSHPCDRRHQHSVAGVPGLPAVRHPCRHAGRRCGAPRRIHASVCVLWQRWRREVRCSCSLRACALACVCACMRVRLHASTCELHRCAGQYEHAHSGCT
jgi:hypothetical protein